MIIGGIDVNKTIKLILTSVALGAGVGTLVLNVINEIDFDTSISLLSIGLICLALVKLPKK